MNYRNNLLFSTADKQLGEFARPSENIFRGMGKLLDVASVISQRQIDGALKPIRPATISDAWKRIGESLNTSIAIEAAELSTENLRNLVKQLAKDAEKLSNGQKALSQKNQQK